MTQCSIDPDRVLLTDIDWRKDLHQSLIEFSLSELHIFHLDLKGMISDLMKNKDRHPLLYLKWIYQCLFFFSWLLYFSLNKDTQENSLEASLVPEHLDLTLEELIEAKGSHYISEILEYLNAVYHGFSFEIWISSVLIGWYNHLVSIRVQLI